MSTDPTTGQYYWCLTHHKVEGADGCKAADRLGPYRTPQEAQDALRHVEQNNEKWDNDPRYNDDDDAEDEKSDGWGPFSG